MKLSQVNATGPHCWEVNIGSGNGLVPSGNKPLHEVMCITRPQWVFKSVIFKHIVVIYVWSISCEITLLWMPPDLTLALIHTMPSQNSDIFTKVEVVIHTFTSILIHIVELRGCVCLWKIFPLTYFTCMSWVFYFKCALMQNSLLRNGVCCYRIRSMF